MEEKRPRIYVVDADFELLNGRSTPIKDRLVVLDRYSIENFLFDEFAIISVLDEEDSEYSFEDIKTKFDYIEWIDRNSYKLFELFVLYAIADQMFFDFPTVSFSVYKITKNRRGDIDVEEIEKRKNEIREKILDVFTISTLEEVKNVIINKCHLESYRRLWYVSGKDYIFPLIFERMLETTSIRSKKTTIIQRLARYCDISDLLCINDQVR